ncbi:HAD family hydrolase [Streptosporangium sp. NBC_01756]|uniref:HAD family hydrolase n=1 Tax=Streptosporangium sp. NBC_01756 TaxID=2975950 RepID=UPI002DDBBBCB|nr:HAD family hydrolase [Streptosporangium sp. NBC_01756]WSC85780.1 HAD family hydrolase [Streptosporangium sp. NBC_01756]
MPDTAILDIDGTLVDTNYQHALAWFRAFGRYDVWLPLWRIHRHIGMGGDQLVAALAGDEVEQRYGDALRDAWVEEFDPYLDEIRPFDGATELLDELGGRGFTVVLASSGKPQHVERFIDLVDGRSRCRAWTTSEDVEATKPAPDLLRVALDKVGGGSGAAVGDSTWDFLAAGRAGMPGVAVRTGGFSPGELRKAGAAHVFDSLTELIANLDHTPLRAPLAG